MSASEEIEIIRASPEPKSSSDSHTRFREKAVLFFDSQLERLNLGKTQIDDQNIQLLEDSLTRIDDALRNPESFGVLRQSLTASGGIAFLANGTAEAVIQIGIVPILLERKTLVIERLRLLRSQRPIQTLVELIDSLGDDGLRERLRTELVDQGLNKPTIDDRVKWCGQSQPKTPCRD
jgi:hypothetical protein